MTDRLPPDDEGPAPDPTGGEHGRDHAGRFRRGASGNPRGRPRGARNRALAMLDALGETHAQGIVAAVIAQAERGDIAAAETILRRCWPAPKGRRVAVRLPPIRTPADAADAAAAVIAATASGDLAPGEAQDVVALLEAHARLSALADLEGRIAALEARAVAGPP